MTLELYPASAHDAFHGTSVQYPGKVDEAVRQIYDACKSLGTDEQTLIAVLGSKSPETRCQISLRYKELYQQPLNTLLKGETSGDFGRLLRMISTPLPETEAQILRDATNGMGTTESLTMQILAGRTNEEISILKRAYFDLVGKDLAVMLNSELSGDFRKVVMAVLQSSQVPYNPAVHNAAKAEEEAVALYRAGQGRLGTNEEDFIKILVRASPEFLKMVDGVYVAKYNNNIAKAVDKEFSGDAKKSLNYLIRLTLDPYSTIAELFEKTMKGLGTDETGLSTALVRYQSLLPHVKAAYKRIYREELRDRISKETSGDYKILLLEIFDAPYDQTRFKTVGASESRAGKAPIGARQSEDLLFQRSNAPTSSARQQPSAPPAYPTPTGQQIYNQPSQAASVEAPIGTILPQTPSPQPGVYMTQTSISHQTVIPSENSYSGQRAIHDQTPTYQAPRISGEKNGDNTKMLLEVYDAPHDPPRIKTVDKSESRAGEAPTGAIQSEFLSSQRSNAPALSAGQQPSAPPAYPTPTGQQSYNQPTQAASVQAPYSTILHQSVPSTQPGQYITQTSISDQAVFPIKNSYSGHTTDHNQTPKYSAPSNSTQQQTYAPSGQQLPIQQYQQYSLPGQPPTDHPYPQYSPGYQQLIQQPPNQHYQQHPAPGGQGQPFPQYGLPPGPELQPPSQQHQQYPLSGLPLPSQPYQQYSVPGQQQASSMPYQRYSDSPQQPYYPPSQYQQYQQYGVSAGQPQQGLSQSYQLYAPYGQQASTESNHHYTGYGQQEYPVPQHPNVSMGQTQPYQQYGIQTRQTSYPPPYGAAITSQLRNVYPPPHQPMNGYPPHQGM